MTEKAMRLIARNKARQAAQVADVIEIQPLLMKVPNAAKFMGVSQDYVEDLIKKGVFKRIVRMGSKVRCLYIKDVERYVAMQTEGAS